jgi:hypothetical protein
MQIYVYTAWVASGDFKAVHSGADPLPNSEKVWAWVLQISFTAVAVATVIWLIRGCRRERRLTLDAKLAIGFVSIIWLDPVPNLLRPQVFFNSYYINRGSWVEHIPGWISANGRFLPDPFFVEFPPTSSWCCPAWWPAGSCDEPWTAGPASGGQEPSSSAGSSWECSSFSWRNS